MTQNVFNRFHILIQDHCQGYVVQWCFKREGKRGTCLGPLVAAVMCKVPCFQRGPTATVMYKYATLLSKGPPTAVVMCKYLAFKGA